MIESQTGDELATVANPDAELTVLALGSVILRRRRLIATLALIGATAGLASGLLSKRLYKSSATFIPQGAESGMTGAAALAASQFGIRVSNSGGAWGPPIYVELLHSRALLDPILLDTVRVAEEQGRRIPVMDLLNVEAPSQALRLELAVRKLREIVTAAEDRKQGAVNLTVTTRWPSVSLAVAQGLVREVNLFNVDTRKSQARAERVFVESQTAEAEGALRVAEDRLQSFLQQNRVISGSSQLEFQRDRLQRDVVLRQQVYNALEQSRQEARIREVRDTPVITVLEEPRLPVVPEPRHSLAKLIEGGATGLILGVFIAFLGRAFSAMRHERSTAAAEFFGLVRESMPGFLRRKLGTRSTASP
jgi:uncharacterized protein involved in exopolysaccharide biosynthesis